MKTFRPIVYNEGDLRSYKYVSGTSVREGHLCAIASSDLNTFYAKITYPAATAAAAVNGTLNTVANFFPIYMEDPDLENVGATIDQNDYVIGFNLTSGNVFEVHKSLTEEASVAGYTFGKGVCIGLNGKYSYLSNGTYASSLLVGKCIGTYNGWMKVRVL
ncbi:hypothetical protein M0R04_05790 [Candidatus Dojkabacteria bacterium]|jgi:hypothetical protein|nr:hypothetical protein [Candidatus Dojkabacteria bacterium]